MTKSGRPQDVFGDKAKKEGFAARSVYKLEEIDRRNQLFRRGNDVHKILWSSASGAHAVKENSAIGREWKAAGSERGYGYPTTGEYRYGTEVRQKFSKNFTVHYSTTTKRTWATR